MKCVCVCVFQQRVHWCLRPTQHELRNSTQTWYRETQHCYSSYSFYSYGKYQGVLKLRFPFLEKSRNFYSEYKSLYKYFIGKKLLFSQKKTQKHKNYILKNVGNQVFFVFLFFRNWEKKMFSNSNPYLLDRKWLIKSWGLQILFWSQKVWEAFWFRGTVHKLSQNKSIKVMRDRNGNLSPLFLVIRLISSQQTPLQHLLPIKRLKTTL